MSEPIDKYIEALKKQIYKSMALSSSRSLYFTKPSSDDDLFDPKFVAAAYAVSPPTALEEALRDTLTKTIELKSLSCGYPVNKLFLFTFTERANSIMCIMGELPQHTALIEACDSHQAHIKFVERFPDADICWEPEDRGEKVDYSRLESHIVYSPKTAIHHIPISITVKLD